MNKKKKNKQNNIPIIGIDLLGGEHSSKYLLEDFIKFAKDTKLLANFICFIPRELENELFPSKNITFQIVDEIIYLDEKPSQVIRRKKKSSLFLGVDFLKSKKIDAFISLGNTGALVSLAKIKLKTKYKDLLPALLTYLPTKKNPIAVLDVGSNISVKAENLLHLALTGVDFVKKKENIIPKVGLLNIGSEKIKGTKELQKAYDLLFNYAKLKKNFKFIGNVEGKDVFKGGIDILVTDGFSGNIFLKTAEGVASFILDLINEKEKNIKKNLEKVEKYLHYHQFRGAILCGLNELIIKCHSYARPQAIFNAIKNAIDILSQKKP